MNKIFLVSFLGLFLLGCGKKEEVKMEMEHRHGMEGEKMGKGMEAENGVEIRKARQDEIGKPATCPVMGTKFNVKEKTLIADYKGKSYYLCCQGCVDPIKKNPEKYAE